MKRSINIYTLFCSLLVALLLSEVRGYAQGSLSTQKEKVETRNGNKQFKDENYTDAEVSYKKALDIKNNMPEATFNLGDAVYEQKRYDESGKQFQLSAQTNADPAVKAQAYHNLGNSFMEQKKWEDAIKAYRNALRFNPNDRDTKYNLAYANTMLKKNKGGGGQNNKKNQKDKKDKQKQDQQNQDKNKDQKQDQKQDKQQQAKDQQDKDKQQKGQQAKLSKEEAEKLLQAVANEEQKTTEKMQKKQMKAVRVKIKKDW